MFTFCNFKNSVLKQRTINKRLIPNCFLYIRQEAEFREFEPRLKFKPRLKCGWFHLKL